MTVQTTLARLGERGVLRPVDRHLGLLLARLDPADDGCVALAGALASRALADGDTCVVVASLGEPPHDEEDVAVEVPWPEASAFAAALARSPLVGDGSPDGANVPLVHDGDRVWLARYHHHEQRLAAGLLRVAATQVPPVDAAVLDASLGRLFHGLKPDPRQQEAVRAAVRQGLTVLAGGPGTGKTTTVVAMLAALLEQAAAAGRPLPRVMLVAPTGKAAARLSESVRSKVATLQLAPDHADAVRAALPVQAVTVHRALGPLNDWLTRMRHDAQHPWAADVVVLDEASMVDLPLMARAVDALKPGGRLILIGDPDQLAAVGAGSVLGDLCREALPGPVGQGVVHLTSAQRYDAEGEIGALARALHDQDLDATRVALRGTDARGDDPGARLDQHTPLLDRAVAAWTAFGRAPTPAERLAAFDRFRVLCAVRAGPSGVDALNAALQAALARAGLIDPSEPWYVGRPVLVTANDYGVELFNGDIGVVDLDAGGHVRVFFRTPEGVRAVLPTRLPAHETVFAMTIHKSQGSEFDEVAVALPPRPHRLLSRELLYTAVTRARERVVVYGSDAVIAAGLAVSTRRTSGLRGALAAGVSSG
ncbi:MAG: exodeoxyribonuclease V subunit alpha [Alphaproteobacteria bacterium]|nr:exodeoxyribonuclease V subunit alpha [Alphaproteobacteria bacterium]